MNGSAGVVLAQVGLLNGFAEVVRAVGPWVFGPGLMGVVLWYLRDRQRDQAAGRVAEGTVGAEVKIKDSTAMGAHVALLESAFSYERASKDRTIAALREQIQDLEQEVAEQQADVAMQRAVIRRLQRTADSGQPTGDS